MKKILLACLFVLGCGPLPPPPPRVFVTAVASVTDYVWTGAYYYYANDCGPVYYYSDGTYDITCTYPPDSVMHFELSRVGSSVANNCPGPSYHVIEYVNSNYDMMDYVVDCE